MLELTFKNFCYHPRLLLRTGEIVDYLGAGHGHVNARCWGVASIVILKQYFKESNVAELSS